VARRDYTRRAEKTSDDEVGVLVTALNEMLDVIEQRNSELLASYQDMTDEVKERKRAQQEVMNLNDGLEQRVRERTAALQQSNRELVEAKASADDANQAKSAFLSSMSHELRTPLNAILGFAQLLESAEQPAELRAEFAGYILKSGRHLLVLINEILNLSQIESGATTVALETVALAEVLAECEAMIAPLARQRDVALRILAEAPLAVLADRTRLKQVLLNLLSNAVKYNRQGGSVTLDCLRTDGGRVQLAVSDTGIGMDEQQMRALFQPFNRLGQEAGTEEGTGIGLVVTKRLVGLMGGTLGASSVAGAGSVFWLELGGADLQRRAAAAAPPAAASATLLYIEANPGHVKLVEDLVRATPSLRLISAPDAVLGIQLARAELPELILMDLQLPGMSGHDALAILRSDPHTAAIPVIALTAGATDDAGGGYFRQLAKPIDPQRFHAALRAALAAAAPPSATETA
jgi:signal transduction histidine kinase/CheY-like chemotaxis protein